MSTVGWVTPPNGRGTIDIIWSCLVTITLCCWSSLCVNVPRRGERQRWRLCDKFNLACIGLLGPEFLFALALGQYLSACRSVTEFNVAGYGPWTKRHAFYADMGGLLLKVPTQQPAAKLPDDPKFSTTMTFPINAKQLCYLVRNQYIGFPTIDVDDMAEGDRLARYITIAQVVWFSVNALGRLIQHLTITTLELTTLAFIPCMIMTSFCWYHKPSSIETATILECQRPLADILKEAGKDAREPYHKTPLEFIDCREWSISLMWAHDLNILRKLHLRAFARQIKGRPITRILNDNWPSVGMKGGYVMAMVNMAYSAIFVAGWNYPFPTNVERTMWRVSSLGTMGYCIIIGMVEIWGFRMYMPRRKRCLEANLSQDLGQGTNLEPNSAGTGHSEHTVWYGSKAIMQTANRLAQRLRNNSPDRDPALEVPLRVLIPMTLLCASYSAFRVFFLVEDFAGLRALPPSAYDTFNWPNWFPHVF